jgi:nucleotide-binding universal stress UspA family protein
MMSQANAPILVPVDGSEPAQRAARFAASLASLTGRPLALVGVLDLIHLDPEAGIVISNEQLDSVRNKFKNDVLEMHRAALPPDAVAEAIVLEGPATKKLLEYIDTTKPFVVVLGRTGKGALERLFQGSVSRALAAQSTSPIIVVP